MIKSFHVYGLHGRVDHEFRFHRDLNIFTGRNGCGKTTLLKLLWYMISPNVERTVPEIVFREAKVATDKFVLEIVRRGEPGKKREKVFLSFSEPRKKRRLTAELLSDEFFDRNGASLRCIG